MEGTAQEPGLSAQISGLERALAKLEKRQASASADLDEWIAKGYQSGLAVILWTDREAKRADREAEQRIQALEKQRATRQLLIAELTFVLDALKDQQANLKERLQEKRCVQAPTLTGSGLEGQAGLLPPNDPRCAPLNLKLYGEDGTGGTVAEWRAAKANYYALQLANHQKQLDASKQSYDEWQRTHGEPPPEAGPVEFDNWLRDRNKLYADVTFLTTRLKVDQQLIDEDKERVPELARSISADRTKLRALGCAERGEAGRATPTPKVALAPQPKPKTPAPKLKTTGFAGTWGYNSDHPTICGPGVDSPPLRSLTVSIIRGANAKDNFGQVLETFSVVVEHVCQSGQSWRERSYACSHNAVTSPERIDCTQPPSTSVSKILFLMRDGTLQDSYGDRFAHLK